MEQSIISAACALGAGLCMGIGAIGPAIGEGIGDHCRRPRRH